MKAQELWILRGLLIFSTFVQFPGSTAAGAGKHKAANITFRIKVSV
jgi:hypothetical protein